MRGFDYLRQLAEARRLVAGYIAWVAAADPNSPALAREYMEKLFEPHLRVR
jgi:hypothetical protein